MSGIFSERAKFLVQWIEGQGLVRGQVCVTREDATRLFNHLKDTDVTLLEIRKIGSLLREGNTTYYYKPSANGADKTSEVISNG